MPESKAKKLKKSLIEAQTTIAKILGTRRIGVLKTIKMSENILPYYIEQCNAFIQLANVAKQIETAANAGEFKNIARKARSCKIAIKSCYEKFVKEMDSHNADITLSSGRLDSSKGEIKQLLMDIRGPLQEITKIYNIAVHTYNNLEGGPTLLPVQTDVRPSAPPMP